jgi:hypothetical protein
VIHVLTAVITAKGDRIMTTNTEQIETAPTAGSAEPKPTKKATAGARRANVAPKKGKPGKKASPAKKAPKSEKKATGARDGSKAAKILDLLKRPGGATSKELQKATRWQPHSVRGFLSGTIGKKMGPDGRFRQGRGRRAQLFGEILICTAAVQVAPPDSRPAAFFVFEDAKLRRPIRQREVQPHDVGMPREDQRFDARDFPAAALDLLIHRIPRSSCVCALVPT